VSHMGNILSHRGPPRDFEWGSPREVKGFGRAIERRSKYVHLVPQTSPKRLLPGPLLIPNFWPKVSVVFYLHPPLKYYYFSHFRFTFLLERLLNLQHPF
jgi:hypothetical protein